MFSGFMVNAWAAGTIVAVVAGVVGFFTVLRGSAFAAHAIPNGAFAGAAGAALIGASTLLGLGVFAVAAALGIALLSRRGRHDVAAALALVTMLALGALFLSRTNEYEPALLSLLFGEILGVSASELVPTAAIAAACALAMLALYRPLMLSSLLPDVAAARGVRAFPLELGFLVILGLATAMTVPVVGTLLIFTLMIGPPAAARALTDRPPRALALSVGLALATVWAAIALSYATDYPAGFFVGTISAACFVAGRAAGARRRSAGRIAPTQAGLDLVAG
jgi:zinc/manganese transport system permease protein